MKIELHKKTREFKAGETVMEFIENNEGIFQMYHAEDYTWCNDDMCGSFESYTYDYGNFNDMAMDHMQELYPIWLLENV